MSMPPNSRSVLDRMIEEFEAMRDQQFPELRDTFPLVLYFADEESREAVKALLLEAFPNMTARPINR